MPQVERDIARFYRESVSSIPDIAISECIGCNGEFANGHRPFVIRRKATGGRNLWEEGRLAEYDSLDEALKYPGAFPYGTSTLCEACCKLSSSLYRNKVTK